MTNPEITAFLLRPKYGRHTKKAPKGKARASGQGGWVHVADALPAVLRVQGPGAANDWLVHSGAHFGEKVQQLRAYGIGRIYYLSVGNVADAGLAAFAVRRNIYLAGTTSHDGAYNGTEINAPVIVSEGLSGCAGLHRALASPIADNRELKTYEPFVLVALGGIGRTSLNKCGLGNNASSDTFDDVVLNQLDTKTCNTVSMRCDTRNRVNRPTDFDVAIGEVADIEGFHLGALLLHLDVGHHLGEGDLTAREFVHSLHSLERHTVVAPLRNCAPCNAKVLGELLPSAGVLVKPFGEFHDSSLGAPKPHVKTFLNFFLVAFDHE